VTIVADIAERLPSEPVGSHREPPPIILGEAQPPPAQLPPQEAILFDEIGECFSFFAIQPGANGAKQQLQSPDVDHEREVISRTARSLCRTVEPTVGQYGSTKM
jgi:hypothetical protein